MFKGFYAAFKVFQVSVCPWLAVGSVNTVEYLQNLKATLLYLCNVNVESAHWLFSPGVEFVS